MVLHVIFQRYVEIYFDVWFSVELYDIHWNLLLLTVKLKVGNSIQMPFITLPVSFVRLLTYFCVYTYETVCRPAMSLFPLPTLFFFLHFFIERSNSLDFLCIHMHILKTRERERQIAWLEIKTQSFFRFFSNWRRSRKTRSISTY